MVFKALNGSVFSYGEVLTFKGVTEFPLGTTVNPLGKEEVSSLRRQSRLASGALYVYVLYILRTR